MTRLLSLLAFINFKNIFLDLFNRDSANILASALTRIIELLEIIILSNKT